MMERHSATLHVTPDMWGDEATAAINQAMATRFEAHLTELFPEVVVTVRTEAGRDEFHMTDAELAEFKQAMEDWDWLADLSAVCEGIDQ